ncbi:hypothetical protein [Comamonas sp. NoAH]|uniref:hypothetical protein n=1 Tax=Comamonas halotolerans TaxID=3041496 RepID=UPI0024E17F25|nr:hypothetical protein [Comamonas sp. NoAH]
MALIKIFVEFGEKRFAIGQTKRHAFQGEVGVRHKYSIDAKNSPALWGDEDLPLCQRLHQWRMGLGSLGIYVQRRILEISMTGRKAPLFAVQRFLSEMTTCQVRRLTII